MALMDTSRKCATRYALMLRAVKKLLVLKIVSLMKHARRRRATADMGKIKRGKYF